MEYLLIASIVILVFGLMAAIHRSLRCAKGGHHDFGPVLAEGDERFHLCKKCERRENLPNDWEIKLITQRGIYPDPFGL